MEFAALGRFRLWLRNVARTECAGASLLWIGQSTDEHSSGRLRRTALRR